MKTPIVNSFSSRGFSLIEVMLVVGVIAIVAVAVFIAYPASKDRNLINVENQRIYRMVGTIRNMYAGVGSYEGINLDAVNAAKAFPSEMNNGNNQPGQPIKNSWDGDVTVGADATDARQFFVSYEGVPEQSCVLLVVGSLLNFQKIEVPAGNVVYEKNVQPDADIDVLTAACTANESGFTQLRFTTY